GVTPATATVTLTGPTGLVEGSVLVSQSSRMLTFVETDTANEVNHGTPILPDGTYVARISAHGPHGLQAAGSGGYLDGLGNAIPGSGDYTATFAINAAAAGDDVVWLPATADGPGQALSAPGSNQVGGGYPIYLSDRSGQVSNVLLTLNYNPSLLVVNG